MIGRVFTGLLNQTLDVDPTLQKRLVPHSEKTVRIALPGFAASLCITQLGRLQQGQGETADVDIHIPLDAVLEWQIDRLAARNRIRIEGDAELALILAEVLGRSHWDAEDLLSRLVGDIAAHRILKIWRDRKDRRHDRWQRLSETVTDYMQFESRLLVSGPELEHFNQQVDILRYQLARLEQRLNLLEKGQQ